MFSIWECKFCENIGVIEHDDHADTAEIIALVNSEPDEVDPTCKPPKELDYIRIRLGVKMRRTSDVLEHH